MNVLEVFPKDLKQTKLPYNTSGNLTIYLNRVCRFLYVPKSCECIY